MKLVCLFDFFKLFIRVTFKQTDMTKNKNDLFQVVFYYKGIETSNENILLSMVENIGGELTASNKYISKWLGLSVWSTSRLINNLKKRGYINVKLVVNKYRTITLNSTVVKLTRNDFSTEKEEDLNPSSDTTNTITSKEDNNPVETPKNEDEGKGKGNVNVNLPFNRKILKQTFDRIMVKERDKDVNINSEALTDLVLEKVLRMFEKKDIIDEEVIRLMDIVSNKKY